MGKLEKKLFIDQLTNEIKEAKSYIFFDYKGLKAEKTEKLRTILGEKNSKMRICKNTFLKKSLEEIGIDDKNTIDEIFFGTVACAYSFEDAVDPAKALDEFLKENKKSISFKGAVLDNKLLNAEQTVNLAKLPSRDELIAKVLYMLNYPLTGLVNVLSGNMRNLVYVLDAIKEKK